MDNIRAAIRILLVLAGITVIVLLWAWWPAIEAAMSGGGK